MNDITQALSRLREAEEVISGRYTAAKNVVRDAEIEVFDALPALIGCVASTLDRCEGCREGWPMDQPHPELHRVPNTSHPRVVLCTLLEDQRAALARLARALEDPK